jgi:SAM-dependent methyltransferase
MSARRNLSAHYEGASGEAYFRWQRTVGEPGAELNRWKFEPHIAKDDRVIDFGCGGGALLSILQCEGKLGVEVNESARDACAAREIDVLASAEELPEEWADVVISNHALEHTTAPLAELLALRRSLKSGGRLVLWLPLEDWRSRRHASLPDRNYHLYSWTPQLVTNLLVEAGFVVESSDVVTSAWLTWFRPLERTLPASFYRALTWTTAVVKRRRQLSAIARKP